MPSMSHLLRSLVTLAVLSAAPAWAAPPSPQPVAPVIEAVMGGSLEKVKAVVAGGARLDAVDANGYTALHWAAFKGHAAMARHLIERGAPVNQQDKAGYTPLMLACLQDHPAVVAVLLKAHVDPTIRSKEGLNAADYAESNRTLAAMFASYLQRTPAAYAAYRDEEFNKLVASHVNVLRMALEMYATDNNGAYPAETEVLAAISKDHYLPGNMLPRNPWGGKRQTNAVAPASLPALRPAAKPVALTPRGTDLGPGQLPGDGGYTARTYGAIVYGYLPKEQIYVVYGIGKLGDRAIVVAAATNGD